MVSDLTEAGHFCPSHSIPCSTVPFPREWNNGTYIKSAEYPTERQRNIFSKSLGKQGIGAEQKGGKPGTAASKSVPPMPHNSSACGTNAEVGCKGEADNLLYEFNEHVAIMEYEGGLMRQKAEGLKQNKEKIKVAAEKETRTGNTGRFKMDANVSVLSVPPGDLFDKESLLYDFEERLAIAEVDGPNANRSPSHRLCGCFHFSFIDPG